MSPYKQFFITVLALLGIMLSVVEFAREQANPENPYKQTQSTPPAPANDNAPGLSQQRARHILYGDTSGGGHLHGTGKPCKSEFPENWSADDIITRVQILAANDNVRWEKADNGYYTSEQMMNGVRVRVVLDREGDDIITAYPVNVQRNPCD